MADLFPSFSLSLLLLVVPSMPPSPPSLSKHLETKDQKKTDISYPRLLLAAVTKHYFVMYTITYGETNSWHTIACAHYGNPCTLLLPCRNIRWLRCISSVCIRSSVGEGGLWEIPERHQFCWPGDSGCLHFGWHSHGQVD